MKKILTLVLLVLCCSSFSAINTVRYENYMNAYYRNLTENFPYNYRGSCGYISMCMLLSYYDSYLSDDVIPEFYDVCAGSDQSYVPGVDSSPGVREDYLSNGYDCTNQEYLDMINYNKCVSLHSYFLSEGIKIGAYHYSLNNKLSFALQLSEELQLLNNYLITKTPFRDALDEPIVRYYSLSNCGNEENIRNAVINAINEGRPIMLSISGTANHSVIAYDYDEEKDIIYCHSGYHGYDTHLDINDVGLGNVTIRYGIDLKFTNVSHSHNDNYILFADAGSDYYCPCSTAIGFQYLFN